MGTDPMTFLQLLGYIADVLILGTYAIMAHEPTKVRWFHWATAVAGTPILVAEVQAGLWQVLVLSGSFMVLGWFGLWKTRHHQANAELIEELIEELDEELLHGHPVHTDKYVPPGCVFLKHDGWWMTPEMWAHLRRHDGQI